MFPSENNPHCPNFGELLQNWKLKNELERERKRREEVEKHNAALTAVGFFLLTLLVAAVVIFITHSGMSAETMEAQAHLLSAHALLFFAFSCSLLAVKSIVNSIIRRYTERKKEKDTTDKKEE